MGATSTSVGLDPIITADGFDKDPFSEIGTCLNITGLKDAEGDFVEMYDKVVIISISNSQALVD